MQRRPASVLSSALWLTLLLQREDLEEGSKGSGSVGQLYHDR